MTGQTVRAAMPWTIMLLVLVFALGVIVWYALDPVVEALIELTLAQEPSEDGEKGLATVQTVWEFWAIWFGGILATFGIVEAIRRSGGRVAR